MRHTGGPPGEDERAVAGALVLGKKGQGKSCLVGRALERHQQDSGPACPTEADPPGSSKHRG